MCKTSNPSDNPTQRFSISQTATKLSIKTNFCNFFSVLSRYKKYKIVSFFLRSTSFQKLFYKYYFFYKKGAFRRKKSKVTKTTREERKWRLSHFKYFEKVFLCFFVIFGRIHKRRKR